MEVPRTLLATGCDPQCKWPGMVQDLQVRHDAAVQQAEQAPFEGKLDDVRPTPEGYELISQVQRDFLGLTGLTQCVENCKAGRIDACGPEQYAEGRVGFGYEVEVAIKSIRGE